MNINIKCAEHEKFETERLILRKIELSDAADLFEICSNPEVARFVTYEPHENIERTKEGIVNYFIPNRLQTWGIVEKKSLKLIGTIDLRISNDSANYGWALHQDYWGQGIVPEAATVLRDFAFDELKLNVLTAEHATENQKSGRVMEKMGMSKLGQLYIYVGKLKKSVLGDYWAITREDYEKIKNK